MRFHPKEVGVSGWLLACSIFPIHIGAQSLSYATGTFSTSGPATITAHPMGGNFPKAIDTVFVFQTGVGNKAEFSLPVALANSAIRPGGSSSPLSPKESRVPFRNAAGRRAPMGHGIRFTEASPFASAVKFAALNFALRTAAVSLQYRISVASQSAQFRDTSGIVKTLVEKDNGVIELRLPVLGEGAGSRFKELLTEAQYQSLFPNRYGFGKTGEASDGHEDFYSYASFIKAIDKLSTTRVKILMRAGTDYAQKLIWTDTAFGTTRTMITHADYNAEWNLDVKEDTIGTIRYADFCAEGTLEIRKRELAAFFANVAHETGGGWEGAPNGGRYAWGLYWREEVAWQTNPGNTDLGYVDLSNTMYPPYPGKSYHGRGPIQVSWNYNYGQASEFLYGDKNILLRAPELVLASGDVAFMTAIWFWMYPQGTTPASHDIMTGKWKPNAADIAAGRDKSRFGATINVVNGVQECGHGADERVADRVGHFKWFSGIFGISLEPVQDCNLQQPF
ncbi:MAG: type sorting protein [Fibrobacteres bacterium]|nr:type sorting protein [Fibrobacterota bacterium]